MSKDSIKNRKKFLILPETKIEDLKTMRLDRLDQRTWLYEAWKEKWNEELEQENDRLFYKLFCYDYIYTCNACVKNKKMNFRMKIVCLLEYIQRYIRMILILSMEKLAMNPGKEQIEYSFVDYMKEIITICEKEPDEQLNQGAKLLKEISENLGVDKLRNNRTNWINYLNGLEANETIYIAEAMVDLCYNYTIEESISNVARHFEDREGFRRDLLNRFHQYWEEYCCKIHVFHKGDLEQIADIQVKEPFWDTAVRLVDQNPSMYSGVYETGYNKRKREWKRVRSRKIGKWFATAFLYIVIFCLVEQMMGTIESVMWVR